MSAKHGIETRAAGQTFRSRLEARWALFFDKIGWDWTYEPFDADGYIPDFMVTVPPASYSYWMMMRSDGEAIAGPYASQAEAQGIVDYYNQEHEGRKTYTAEIGHEEISSTVVPLLVEIKPFATVAECAEEMDRILPKLVDAWHHDVVVLGASPIINERGESGFPSYKIAGLMHRPGGGISEARWLECIACEKPGLFHGRLADETPEVETPRPCGHEVDFRRVWLDFYSLDLWKAAGDEVQWKP